jgi:hypothetical protein
MSAMLCFRHNEQLLDALLSLTEIFRLISYIEHVLRTAESCPSRASSDPGVHCASIERPRRPQMRLPMRAVERAWADTAHRSAANETFLMTGTMTPWNSLTAKSCF